MAVRTLITRGYGNGTFNSTISELVLRGYSISDITAPNVEGIEYTISDNQIHYTESGRKMHYNVAGNPIHYTIDD